MTKTNKPQRVSDSSQPACSAFHAALRRMLDKGVKTFSAQDLANEMWPRARHDNANGQVFNLASGIAGTMLRKHRGAHEIRNRQWIIVEEFLPNASNQAERIKPEN